MSADRSRVRRILSIGVPILGGMGSSALLSLVDTAMVGWLGSAELAAVGLGSFASWIYLGFFQGLTIAVQALVSRRVGQGRIDEAGASLNAALLLLIAVAPTSAAMLWCGNSDACSRCSTTTRPCSRPAFRICAG